MKVSALRQMLHDKNDDDDVFFVSFDGEPIDIQAHVYIPEWRSIYLGEEEDGLLQSMMEYEANLTDEEKEMRDKFDQEWDEAGEEGEDECGASEGSDLGARCDITPSQDPHHDVDYELL